jgi:uncharacterized iron-regulated membrane protein
MTAKKIFGQLHLWLGLASSLVVLVVALSGSILVFEKEIDESVNSDFYFVEVPANTQRLPVDQLLAAAKAFDPAVKVTNIRMSTADAGRSAIFGGKKGEDMYVTAVNPFTGKVIRSINHSNRFFTIVLQLHRRLLMGDVGKAITGVSCLIFLSLIITGLVLWWPKRRKMLKQRLTVKWDASRKRLNWDLHAISGFYVHLVLFTIALTGLTWSYKWFNNGIFLLFDGKPMKKMEAPANKVMQPAMAGYYEKVYQDANKKLSYKGNVNIILPPKDSLAITVSKENLEAGRTNIVDVIYFEKGTGTLLKERLYKNETAGWKVRRAIYPIHTGNIYGWPTKIIAFISCLVGASLPITGLFIWLGRKKKKSAAKKLVVQQQTRPVTIIRKEALKPGILSEVKAGCPE